MKKLLITALACLLVMGFSSQASAALITGSQAYSATGLTATINYNVYAPGDPDTDCPLGSISDYSYFYEIINASGSVALHQFTVGNPDSVTISGTGNQSGIASSPIIVYSTSTAFNYSSPELSGGTSSEVYLTSPYKPYLVSGSLQNTGVSDHHPIPGPAVPEPMSMALFGMGILGLAGLKRKKS